MGWPIIGCCRNPFWLGLKIFLIPRIKGGAPVPTCRDSPGFVGKKHIFIFSDLKEELVKGHIRDFPIQLSGCKVVALIFTKLRSDNIDPREYYKRVDQWKERVEAGGGYWRVINDLERVESILAD